LIFKFRIGLWQHDRITELIINNLGFVTKLEPVTNSLAGKDKNAKLVLVANKNASQRILGLQNKNLKNPPMAVFDQQKKLMDLFRDHLQIQETKNKRNNRVNRYFYNFITLAVYNQLL
jgi:hypothetical protein